MSRRHRTARAWGLKPAPAFVTDEPTPEYMPTGTLDRHVAEARARMGDARWQQLQEEWK